MARSTPWFVEADPFLVDDEEVLSQTLGEVITILTRIGGAVIIAAHREEIQPGAWVTTGYHVKYESYMPGKRYEEKPEPEAVQSPEPAEVAA